MGYELTFPRSVCSGNIPLPLSSAPQYRPLGTFCVEKRPGPVFAPHTQNPTQNDLDNLIFQALFKSFRFEIEGPEIGGVTLIVLALGLFSSFFELGAGGYIKSI